MKNFRRAFFHFAFLVLLALLAFQMPNLVVAQGENPVEIKINPQIFDLYVGQYQDDIDAEVIISFFREDDKFYVQVIDQPKFEIFPASETSFFLKIFNARVDFIKDAGGKVTSSVAHFGGK